MHCHIRTSGLYLGVKSIVLCYGPSVTLVHGMLKEGVWGKSRCFTSCSKNYATIFSVVRHYVFERSCFLSEFFYQFVVPCSIVTQAFPRR